MKLGRGRTPQGHDATMLVDNDVAEEVAQTLGQIVGGASPTRTGVGWSREEIEWLAPIPEMCRGLLCAGINYHAHQIESAAEFSASTPSDPIFFFKTTSAVAAPYADLILSPDVSSQFDWEVELGVVIGKRGRNISAGDASTHIFGYTVVNDITARDLQRRHQQWHLGKNVDAATPVGPWIVTADEFAFPPRAALSLTVNGIQKQAANSSLMIFGIAEQIAALSRSMTLEPGDIISTGTPSGVGFTRNPPEYLLDGDLVEAEIEGVGLLRNRVIARTENARVATAAPLPVGSEDMGPYDVDLGGIPGGQR